MQERLWNKRTFKYLNKMIKDAGSKGSPSYIVSDWDNTAASFDVEENTLLYQILNLRYEFTPQEIREVLTCEIDSVPEEINELVDKIEEDYKILYPYRRDLNKLKKIPEYESFVAAMAYYFQSYVNSLEYGLSSRKFTHVFYKMTEEEVRDLAGDALSYFKDYKDYKMNFKVNMPKGESLSSSYDVGLREIKEMSDLFKELFENKIDVYICSASFKILVEEFASSKLFNYRLPKDSVMGLELIKDKEGRFTMEVKEDSKTYLQGKADAIKRLEERYKCPPLLYMGDSRGDYYALTYSGLQYGLIIDRGPIGKLEDLKKLAFKENPQGTFYLIQERDNYKGEFKNGN
ncbi:haloacid dehalogenase-like hydrolase [Peptoniphilus catoniae]|uniref:haloacid dehalogenase-like hydrolase n=1 Tax=Peptoniphilus catoniae TaxID=1660341 RepID=UPI0010FE766D|nr:haloacid dehalogenase-like hydrolase [Peptoniphilus catoniae]